MAQAKYTVMIPQKDNLGNHLGDLAAAAHHWLHYGPANVQASFIHRGLSGHWRDDPQEQFDHLVTIGEDHPETESHIKQLASHVAQAANQWGVFVMKEGPKGPNGYVIDNPDYRHGEPSELAHGVANGTLAHNAKKPA